VTAECGAPFLAAGGHIVVSEPPDGDDARWPAEGVQELGLAADGIVRTEAGSYRLLRQVAPCPDRYPRRVGMPAKRPLF
jgi:16S rRNA (guanine527-N7)-methyltransferase